MSDWKHLYRRLRRERDARQAAELSLERKSRELSAANIKLTELADTLRGQVEQTKAMLEAAAEGIITYNQDGWIASFNRSARRLFGVSHGVGHNIREFFEKSDDIEDTLFPPAILFVPIQPPDFPIDCDADIYDPIECIGLRHGCIPFTAEISTSRTVHRQKTLYTALVRDLSRRKLLEERLSHAKRMESIGQLAAGMAHEINTPIQYVGDNLQFINESFDLLLELTQRYDELLHATDGQRPLDDTLHDLASCRRQIDFNFIREEFPVAIKQSQDGIHRIARLIQAMKEFSLPSSDTASAYDLNRAIENVLMVVGSRLQDQIAVETSLDPELGSIVCLASQLNQSLLNLLSNAIESISVHCQPGTGWIAIHSLRHGDYVELRVSDNGHGISPAIQQRIFDPFFTTKPVGQGSGQGLAFVYDVIVNKHQGAIHATTNAHGGATFVISLPLMGRSSSEGREHAVLTR